MTSLYVAVIFILLFIICIQYYFGKKKVKELNYISYKLQEVIEKKSKESLMLFTDDIAINNVLSQINLLIDYNRKIMAKYIKSEDSIKKMLSNISHDLKTPLTVIIGYLEILNSEDNISDSEKKNLLNKLENKTKELIDFINEFFNLAKLESGDNDIQISKVNINEICRRKILAFYEVLSAKGINVEINIPEESFYILGNEGALDSVLDNLISNGIKYGCDGKVIGIDLKADESFVYIEIWDRGKGINEIDKNKVFERLYTLEDSRNKLYQGSGLGLTITKRFVEKLGGEIYLNSVPYDKTVFSVKLKKIDY